MRKKLLLLLLALVVGVGDFAYAVSNRVQHLDLGVYGAGASNGGTVEDGGYAGMNLSYGILPWLAVGAEGGWQENDAAVDERVGYVTALGDIIFRLPLEYLGLQDWRVVPFTNIGFGTMGTYVTDEGPMTDNGDDVDETEFAWKWGIGVDWFVTDSAIAYFETSYFNSDPDLPTSTIKDEESDFWTVGGGIKFVF